MIASPCPRLIWLCALLFAAFVATQNARADEVNLIFGTTTPGNSDPRAPDLHIFHSWAQQINDRGKGVVHIDTRDDMSLANPANSYNRVLDDVVQISVATVSAVAGKFPRAAVANLPFEAENSEQGSVALWRLYESKLLDAEFDEVVPLFLFSYAPSYIHLVKVPASLTSFDRLRLIAGGKVSGQIISLLGGAPLSFNIMDDYQALQRGTADGVIGPWPILQTFKLSEVTSYHLEAPLGAESGMIFMARKRYDALPAAARKIIDDNSGEAAGRLQGQRYDQFCAQFSAALAASGHHTVSEPSPALLADWKAKTASVRDQWLSTTPNGAKILAAYEGFLAEAAAGQ